MNGMIRLSPDRATAPGVRGGTRRRIITNLIDRLDGTD
nr:hypothetical protein JVH1_7012 [Rhodococcus sp. JVH1]